MDCTSICFHFFLSQHRTAFILKNHKSHWKTKSYSYPRLFTMLLNNVKCCLPFSRLYCQQWKTRLIVLFFLLCVSVTVSIQTMLPRGTKQNSLFSLPFLVLLVYWSFVCIMRDITSWYSFLSLPINLINLEWPNEAAVCIHSSCVLFLQQISKCNTEVLLSAKSNIKHFNVVVSITKCHQDSTLTSPSQTACTSPF